MKIVSTYVTFEQAKLLKEKGFDLLVNNFYSQNGKKYPRILQSGDEPAPFESEDFYENFNTITRYEVDGKSQNVLSAPEQWQVVEWLRINHDIWIDVTLSKNEKKFTYLIQSLQFDSNKWTAEYFDIPQDAYSAAFDYVLKNLI